MIRSGFIASPAEIRARLKMAGLTPRAMWVGDDRRLRVGRSGDVVTMLDDLRVPAVGEVQTPR